MTTGLGVRQSICRVDSLVPHPRHSADLCEALVQVVHGGCNLFCMMTFLSPTFYFLLFDPEELVLDS